MNEELILKALKKSIDEAPIDLLDKIKSKKIVKMIEHDEITMQKRKINHRSTIVSMASLAAVIMLFINFQVQYRTADSKIYIDINPSIEITTNRKDKVIDLVSINQDALDIIEDIDYDGKDFHIVTEEIVESLVNKSYIDDQDEIILLSVFNKDMTKSTKQSEELNNSIHEQLKKVNKEPILLTQSLDKSNTIIEYAKEYNSSVGKMTFIRNLIILNPELKTEDLVKLSLSELVQIIQDYELDIKKIINSIDIDRLKKPSQEILSEDNDDFYSDDSFEDSKDIDKNDYIDNESSIKKYENTIYIVDEYDFDDDDEQDYDEDDDNYDDEDDDDQDDDDDDQEDDYNDDDDYDKDQDDEEDDD